MKTKLKRIAEIARNKPKERFTSLCHLLNKEALGNAHREIEVNKAAGVDGVGKEDYADNLDENLTNLTERLKSKRYRPQPARRAYIPKDNNDRRPLGIITHEDKIVQRALKEILESIYERDFLDCSFGFRPNRSCHDALKELNRIIEEGQVNYVVDADIRGFFENVDHKWMVKFLGQRIADPNIISLVVRFLKSGVMEEDEWEPSEVGTQQGGSISPLLANVYLHYVLDLWFEKKVKKQFRGQATITRYCDDFVCCFEHREEAESFYQMLRERLGKFGLEIAEDKSKIIAFGRKAQGEARRRGRKKPDTFDFLGFTHYCSQSRKGFFRVKRKTASKKMRQKLKAFNQWMKAARHMQGDDLWKRIKLKLAGHYRYYGITDNMGALTSYLYFVKRYVFKWLNRRSQRKSYSWKEFVRLWSLSDMPPLKIYVSIYDL